MEQECKAFDLRLKRKFPSPDASTFVAGAKVQGVACSSVAEKTIAKYLNGPSIDTVKHSPCLGCESPHYLAMDCPRQTEPDVWAKNDQAVAEIRAARKARGDKAERRRKNQPDFRNFSGGHQKKVRTQVLAAMAEEADDGPMTVERHPAD